MLSLFRIRKCVEWYIKKCSFHLRKLHWHRDLFEQNRNIFLSFPLRSQLSSEISPRIFYIYRNKCVRLTYCTYIHGLQLTEWELIGVGQKYMDPYYTNDLVIQTNLSPEMFVQTVFYRVNNERRQKKKKRKQKNLRIQLFRVSKINGNNWSTMQPEAFETNIVPTNVYGLNLHPLLNGFAQNNYSNRVHKVSLNGERLIEAFLNDV